MTIQAPTSANAGQAFSLAAVLAANSVPAISYHWDFGDGTEAAGQNLTHTYTLAGNYTGKLTVKGVEGLFGDHELFDHCHRYGEGAIRSFTQSPLHRREPRRIDRGGAETLSEVLYKPPMSS